MKVRIIESNKIENLDYIVDGIHCELDIISGDDNIIDNGNDDIELRYSCTQDTFNFWSNIFKRMERIDSLKEELVENGHLTQEELYEELLEIKNNNDIDDNTSAELELLEMILYRNEED